MYYYWLDVKGIACQTLGFDSKLTRYDIFHELDRAIVKFSTLRMRVQTVYGYDVKMAVGIGAK